MFTPNMIYVISHLKKKRKSLFFPAGVAMVFGYRHNSEGFRQFALQTVDTVAGLTQCEL